MKSVARKWGIVLAISAVAACAPAPKPAPPAPPPVVVVPPPPPPQPIKPLPPGGAATNVILPARDLNGVWATPNQGLSRDEALWHFRSAINVAALSCRGFSWDLITPHYNKMLVQHKSRLATANKTVDAEYKKRFPGQNALRVRDTRSTALYNYFALPAVRTQFCDTALTKVTEAITVPSAALTEYGGGSLADFDKLFQDFYSQYAEYQLQYSEYLVKLDAWNAQYGPKPVMLAPQPSDMAAPMPATQTQP